MKNSILVFLSMFLFFIIACSKTELPTPYAIPQYDTNKYGGVYVGQYYESDNGVDSNGVFKSDTSYSYSLTIQDAGTNKIIIVHGPIVLPTIEVDSTDHFSFVDYNRNITGYFSNDSLYVSSKSLNGSYNYPQWFVIQQLVFKGKKQI